MTHTYVKSLLSTVGLCVASCLWAAPTETAVSFDYLELGYQVKAYDDTPNANGYVVGGSWQPELNWLVFFESSSLSSDEELFTGGANPAIDETYWRIGGGWIYPISNYFDGYAALSFERFDVDQDAVPGLAAAQSFSNDGFSLEIGGRGLLTDYIEMGVYFRRLDLDTVDDTLAGIYSLWYLTKDISVGLKRESSGSFATWSLLGRYGFSLR